MFAIVDIETCGGRFNYPSGRIIDICIVIHDGLSVVDKFSTLINPECYISSFYTSISGITNEMVKDAPTLGKLCDQIGITINNRHRAEGDAIATAALFDRLLKLRK